MSASDATKPATMSSGSAAGTNVPDKDEAERFLCTVDPNATFFTFQTFDDNKVRKKAFDKLKAQCKREVKPEPIDPYARTIEGTLDRCWDRLVRLNEQGAGVFVTINATDHKGRRREKNIIRIRALFVDLDGSPLEPVLQWQHAPQVVVESSPGKFHGYWLVADTALKTFEQIQKALAKKFSGDPKVSDLSRVMRLPGFVHRKAEPFLSRLISTADRPPYMVAELFPDGVPADDAAPRHSPPNDDSYWAALNSEALENLDAWVPALFPEAIKSNQGWRVSSISLGRDLEEDLSLTPQGIKDFGIHDMGDAREGRRSPIDVVMEHGGKDFGAAVAWLQIKLPSAEAVAKREAGEAALTDHLLAAFAAKRASPAAALLQSFFAEELEQEPLCPVDWIIEDFIPSGTVTGFFGDGGTGKDLLLFQLATCALCGALWLGKWVKTGRVLYFPVEDTRKELRRRQAAIVDHYDIRFADFPRQFKITPLIGKDAVLAAYEQRSGVVKPTPLYAAIRKEIEEFKPALVIVPNRVNIFGVNQNDDAQARQSMQYLFALAEEYATSVIMPGHVSLSGMSTDSGTSGSVQWSNACRSRLYLSRIAEGKGEEYDPEARLLAVRKSNWGPTDKKISIRWSQGVFVLDTGAAQTFAGRQAAKDAENEFLRMLDLTIDNLSLRPSSHNYAPKVLSEDVRCRLRGRQGKRALAAAMEQLVLQGILKTEAYGPPSNRHERIVRASPGAAT